MPVQDAQSDARLHDETLQELGLTVQPFLEDKKRQPVTDSTTQKTRAALEQHVRFGESLHLLIGESGAGKTVLLQQLLKHCKSSIKPFVVKGSEEFQANAFLYAVLNELTGDEPEAESLEEFIELLEPIFDQITAGQLGPLLIIDDAHLAPIKEVALLVDALQNFENEDGKTARLLLTGTPALQHSISGFEEQFEGLDLRYSTTVMQAFDEKQTRDYLSARLQQAGFADTFPFTDKAINKIHHESGGLPGQINHSASHYLNGVYRGEKTGSATAGWFASLEWPVLAVGAAALAAIGLGLLMFFGGDSDPEVIPVAATDTAVQQVVQEQPVVAPTSVNDTAQNATQDLLVVDDSTVNITPISDPVVEDANAGTEVTPLVIPESEVVENVVDQAPDDPVAGNTNPIDVTVPAPVSNQDPAVSKSVSNIVTGEPENQEPAGQPSDNLVLQTTDPVELAGTLGSEPIAVDSGIENNIADEPVSSLLGGDTDAAAPAPIDNFSDTGNETETGTAPDTDSSTAPVSNPAGSTGTIDPNRTIENERWVLFQSPVKFTVQLATSRERDYIIELAKTMEVQDPVAIYPFLTTNSNNAVFGLLSGIYDTRSEAIAAVEDMSDEAKKFGVWIRPVSDLQADIKRRN